VLIYIHTQCSDMSSRAAIHSLVLTVGKGMGVVGKGEYRVFGDEWFVAPAAAT